MGWKRPLTYIHSPRDNHHHHKATTAIAKASGRVVVETLNVAGMIRNRRLARAIPDAGMSGFLGSIPVGGRILR